MHNPEGAGGPDPREISSSIGFYRNKQLDPLENVGPTWNLGKL